MGWLGRKVHGFTRAIVSAGKRCRVIAIGVGLGASVLSARQRGVMAVVPEVAVAL